MIFVLLTFFTAVLLSAVAGYFSIIGLITIFPSAPISIGTMGVVLELAKLVTASWVFRNWLVAPAAIRYYFVAAVITLSLLTSMGIFGFLSKAHIEHTTLSSSSNIELVVLEQQEAVVQAKIDFLLTQSNKLTQSSPRIERELSQAQKQLTEIIQKKAPLLQNKNKLDAEIGPLKYIAELIYGKSNDELIEKAVRLVIIMLVFVFDPLAILLLIGANISLKLNNSVGSIDFNRVNIDKSKIQDLTKVNPSEKFDIT
jgi:hypothetical protein